LEKLKGQPVFNSTNTAWIPACIVNRVAQSQSERIYQAVAVKRLERICLIAVKFLFDFRQRD
jgi:hypothetical protein